MWTCCADPPDVPVRAAVGDVRAARGPTGAHMQDARKAAVVQEHLWQVLWVSTWRRPPSDSMPGMSDLPPQIVDRIRKELPAECCVLPGSLPVVSFGDLSGARVATLSLNPSSAEFLSNKGEWLLGSRRRLASLVSLGESDPRELDDDAVTRVLRDSNAYFAGPNWYRQWFGRLEALLAAASLGSYLDGTACHLDLVQWCTDPIQRYVPSAAWRRLVETDREFLGWQLRQHSLAVILVNGMSCVQELQAAGVVQSWTEDRIPYATKSGVAELRVFQAEEFGIQFLGWNRPVAGHLPADGHERLRDWLLTVANA